MFTLTVSRVYTFHNALQGEWTKLENEKWLLQQCADSEFYFNMKEHTDLCALVVANANSNSYLNALQVVAASAHMCGTSSCMDMIHTMVQRLGWQLVGLAMVVMLFFPNILYMFYRGSMSRAMTMRENHIISNGNHGGMGSGWSPYYCNIAENEVACSSLRRRKVSNDATSSKMV